MDTKEAYLKKIEADLAYAQAWLKKAEADLQFKGTRTYEELKHKIEDLSSRLAALRDAGDEGWQELKEAIDRARTDLEAGWKAARKKVEA